jgi:hypothetical protein
MHHRSCGREGEFHNLVGRWPAEIREKSNAASVVLFERKGSLGVRDRNGAVVRDGANLEKTLCS